MDYTQQIDLRKAINAARLSGHLDITDGQVERIAQAIESGRVTREIIESKESKEHDVFLEVLSVDGAPVMGYGRPRLESINADNLVTMRASIPIYTGDTLADKISEAKLFSSAPQN